jgi:hypothetical protein
MFNYGRQISGGKKGIEKERRKKKGGNRQEKIGIVGRNEIRISY